VLTDSANVTGATLGREGENRLPLARAPLNAGSIAEPAAAREDGEGQEGAVAGGGGG